MNNLKHNTMRTQVTSIFVILIAIFSLSSCGGDQQNVIALIDISKSIPTEVRAGYFKTLETDVCNKLTQFDKLTIFILDGAGSRSSQPLMVIDFYENRAKWDLMGQNTNETNMLKKAAFSRFVQEQMVTLQAKLELASQDRTKISNSTEILGTLDVVQQYLQSDARNSVIVFSDMEQYANHLKMKKGASVHSWIQQANAYKLDKLKGAQLCAITGNQLQYDQKYCDDIKEFWLTYCSEKGIALAYNPPVIIAESE